MSTAGTSVPSRVWRAFTRLLLAILVLGLLASVAVLLSRLNAGSFSARVADGQLVVLKGRSLPYGYEPFTPKDPLLAEAYAPVPLGGHLVPEGLVGHRFPERDELDRALFPLLESLAKLKLGSDAIDELNEGLYFVKRTEKLSGLSQDQRTSLRKVQADVAYFLGRSQLDEARRSVAEGLAQLKVAANGDTRHARAANQMITAVEGAALELEEALRRAVHTLGEVNGRPLPPSETPGMAPDAGLPVPEGLDRAGSQTGTDAGPPGP